MRTKPVFISLLFALALAGGGCKKFLDKKLLGQYTPGNFFTSDANAQMAVNAAYAPLSFTSGASNAIWVLGDVASDDAIKGGQPGDQADFDAIDQFNILTTNSAVEAVWRQYYDGVFRCNVVLDGLGEGNTAVSDAVKKSSIAQARFLRAYYYFELTVCYGEIPLHLKVESLEELQSPALSQDSIFRQIEQDCLAAAPDLPDATHGPDLGRASKGAALSLLARTYLFHSSLPNHFQLAAQYAQQVVDSKQYSLTKEYWDNFDAAKKDNTEAIFTINHITGAQPIQGNELNAWFSPRALTGYGFFYPTQDLVDNFEAGDPRLDYTVGRQGHPYFDRDFDPSWSTTGYITKKMVQPLSEVPIGKKNDGSVNYEAIRYADVLLILAEALNESGNSAGALAPLDSVRSRVSLPAVTTTDQAQLRDAIRKERRSELAMEFHRFFDVIRYGSAYATSVLSKGAPNFNYEKNKWFPIPQSERDTNKKLGK
ncbi:MAG TPA: RagB/SusD family nutrient uptake outer membrane protein [Puia sp.]|jgi:hypothetical protein|nr:RagB/SusD family nutrient uptake outer membrane protein [Puia sp.]